MQTITFYDDTTEQDIATLIMERQHKTIIRGVEIILPKQGYRMTYKERLRAANKEARVIIKLLN